MKNSKIFFLIITLILFFEFSNAQTYPQEVMKDINSHCKKKWTKRGALDQEMFDYCVTQEKEGYDNLKFLETKYKSFEWLKNLENSIKLYWTKEGIIDWEMVHYSLNNEIEAFLNIEYGLSHGEFKKETYNSCYAMWKESSPQSVWSMTEYCLKNP